MTRWMLCVVLLTLNLHTAVHAVDYEDDTRCHYDDDSSTECSRVTRTQNVTKVLIAGESKCPGIKTEIRECKPKPIDSKDSTHAETSETSLSNKHGQELQSNEEKKDKVYGEKFERKEVVEGLGRGGGGKKELGVHGTGGGRREEFDRHGTRGGKREDIGGHGKKGGKQGEFDRHDTRGGKREDIGGHGKKGGKQGEFDRHDTRGERREDIGGHGKKGGKQGEFDRHGTRGERREDFGRHGTRGGRLLRENGGGERQKNDFRGNIGGGTKSEYAGYSKTGGRGDRVSRRFGGGGGFRFGHRRCMTAFQEAKSEADQNNKTIDLSKYNNLPFRCQHKWKRWLSYNGDQKWEGTNRRNGRQSWGNVGELWKTWH